ncbi:hypothetical protein GCM10010924_51790 [Rhizobium wenxiniae]|nr:hypothetical protein GCM10010924_51790 [Rhizobium wenxiniae]
MLKAQIEADHHAAGDIYRQGQPRALQWLAVYSVNNKEIDQRVIDLHDFQRVHD